MRNVTLCFLVKEKDNQITKICLAMKKRGFGAGNWNGAGGKVNDQAGETVKEALIRETKEEVGVEVKDFYKVGEIEFIFPEKAAWDQLVHVYLVKDWVGEPQESEEMQPKWFAVEEIPYDSMWSSDAHWLPKVLSKKLVKARFLFNNEAVIQDHHLTTVDSL